MATTTSGIWTPDDSDDWDITVDLAAMANSIQSLFNSLPTAVAAGSTAAFGVIPANDFRTQTINFPSGRFSVTPKVVISLADGTSRNLDVRLSAKSANSITVRIGNYSSTDTPAGTVVDWVAIQMGPNSAAG